MMVLKRGFNKYDWGLVANCVYEGLNFLAKCLKGCLIARFQGVFSFLLASFQVSGDCRFYRGLGFGL